MDVSLFLVKQVGIHKTTCRCPLNMYDGVRSIYDDAKLNAKKVLSHLRSVRTRLEY